MSKESEPEVEPQGSEFSVSTLSFGEGKGGAEFALHKTSLFWYSNTTMLDIKFIRENPDLIKEAARKKKKNFNVDELLEVDKNRLALLSDIENLRAEQNKASEEIGKTGADPVARTALIESMKVVKENLQKKEEEQKEIMKTWHGLMLSVPNMPDMSVPEGKDESENVEVFAKGEIPHFDFEPKDHVEIMLKLGMVDFDRGVKTHGFRGYFLTGKGAALSWAIWNYAREYFGSTSGVEVIAPAIVRKQHFYGTGHLPNDAEDLFETQDKDNLSGTAEIPMMAFHSDEILDVKDLPKKYFAFSPCYRREAGAHSKDVKGLIRVHEFYKFEQLIISTASHEESAKLHEEITAKTEGFVESLGLPYRRVVVCTGDLGASKVKQYELELWVPLQKTYREIGSASYFHDFQTRRFNIRYRDTDGTVRYTHSLNNTAATTPRILVSLVENFQQADGSIKVPEVLRKYTGFDTIQ